MSTIAVNWMNRSWDYISNGQNNTNEAPSAEEHQNFINTRNSNFAMRATPAQTFSLGATLLFGLSYLFSSNSDNNLAKWTTGILATIGAAATAFFGLTKGWSVEETKKSDNNQQTNTTTPTEEVANNLISISITEEHKTQIMKPGPIIKENIGSEFQSILSESGKIRVASKNITPEEFDKAGLPNPEYKISLNGSTYFLSEPFQDETMNRPSFILYLATEEEDGSQNLHARGLYKSNSQNIWRVASHTTERRNWLGKGWGEHTTGIPIEIQSALVDIEREFNWQYEYKNHLCDALKQIDSMVPPDSFQMNLNIESKNIGKFTDPKNPASFEFDNEQDKPNFDSGIGRIYKNNNSLYGEVTSFIVESHNKEFLYQMNLDSEGRAWVGDIQYTYPKLNTYGVKVKPLNIDSKIFTPAYEYKSQIQNELAGDINPRNHHYYDYSAYTNNIPIVKEFLEKVAA